MTFAAAQAVSPASVPENSPAPAKRAYQRLDYIDTLRGLAALWVVFFHVDGCFCPGTQTTNHLTQALRGVVSFGQLGVNMFLVVSGFCLFYPVACRNPIGYLPRIDFKHFMGRRAQRILPPYYAIVLILIAWFYAAEKIKHRVPGFPQVTNIVDKRDLVAHFLLIHNLFPKYIASLGTPFWSIALEWQLYLVFPVLVWLSNRRGLWPIASGTLAMGLALQFYVWTHYHPAIINDNVWHVYAATYWSLPSRLFEFVMGMIAASYVARPRKRQAPAALVALLIAGYVGIPVYQRYGAFAPATNQIWGIVFASLIVVLGAAHVRWPRAIGYLHPLTTVGTFSYSLYLIHMPIVIALRDFVIAQKMTVTTTFLLFLTVVLPLILGYAFVFYLLFEAPFMRRRDGRRPRASESGETVAGTDIQDAAIA